MIVALVGLLDFATVASPTAREAAPPVAPMARPAKPPSARLFSRPLWLSAATIETAAGPAPGSTAATVLAGWLVAVAQPCGTDNRPTGPELPIPADTIGPAPPGPDELTNRSPASRSAGLGSLSQGFGPIALTTAPTTFDPFIGSMAS